MAGGLHQIPEVMVIHYLNGLGIEPRPVTESPSESIVRVINRTHSGSGSPPQVAIENQSGTIFLCCFRM